MPAPITKTDIATSILETKTNGADSKAERRAKFEAAFEVIRQELLDHFAKEGMPKEAVEWYKRVWAFFRFFWSSSRLVMCLMPIEASLSFDEANANVFLEPQLQCSWWKIEPWHVCRRFCRDLERKDINRRRVPQGSCLGMGRWTGQLHRFFFFLFGALNSSMNYIAPSLLFSSRRHDGPVDYP